MKSCIFFLSLALIACFAVSCSCLKKVGTKDKQELTAKEMEISGLIKGIENGKDGYTATLVTADGKTYQVVISRINLQISNSKYERYALGDRIWVRGESWKDAENQIHIKAVACKKID